MLTLRLIGPDERFEYDWEGPEKPPSVLIMGNKVWVQAQSYENASTLYYEQSGWDFVASNELRPAK